MFYKLYVTYFVWRVDPTAVWEPLCTWWYLPELLSSIFAIDTCYLRN